MLKKKLQVFISSTYIDLKDERQAAVEAILKADHIPAGMELFKAGNDSQLTTIKKWIDNSDIYMLILGGRYGSIEEKTGKSYTHLEYDYALTRGIPVFAVVLSDSFIDQKAKSNKKYVETDNVQKYETFKEYVKTKMIKEVEDIKDIQLAIYESLKELNEENSLSGWIRGDLIDENVLYSTPYRENAKSISEIEQRIHFLSEQLIKLKIKSTEVALSSDYSIRYRRSIFFYLILPISNIPRKINYNLSDFFVFLGACLQNKSMSKRQIKKAIINDFGIHPYIVLVDSDVKVLISKLINNNLIIEIRGDYIERYQLTDFGEKVLQSIHKTA